MEYIARKNEENGKEQPLKDHLKNVAELTSQFASIFKSDNLAYQIGYLHDIGKYSDAFQKRIRGSLFRE